MLTHFSHLSGSDEFETFIRMLRKRRAAGSSNPHKKIENYEVSTFAATGSTLDLVISTLRVG